MIGRPGHTLRVGLAILLGVTLLVGVVLPRLLQGPQALSYQGLRILAEPEALELSGGESLRVPYADRPLAMTLESEQPLRSLVLDLSERAPSRLEIEGGELGVRMFRPDGTVVFEILLPAVEPERRGWWGPKVCRYPLRLVFVEADPGALTLRLAAQPLVTEETSDPS